MDDTTDPYAGIHTCAIAACDVEIPSRLLMCMTHWRLVPKDRQDAVKGAWQNRQRDFANRDALTTHVMACSAAVRAVEARIARPPALPFTLEGGFPDPSPRVAFITKADGSEHETWELQP